mgnify:CR=1 FL=1
MKNHIWRGLILLAALLIALQSFNMLVLAETKRSGVTYYVDSRNGSDFYDGKSQNKAWKSIRKVNQTTFKPGDTILFKAGSNWSGQLAPKGSGSPEEPIIIDMYGEGNKPIITAAYDERADAGTPSRYYAFQLRNQQYWEINNLEISGNSDPNCVRGMVVFVKDEGTMNHIYIKKCFVHDIAGDIENKVHGGIMYIQEGYTVKSNFNDILIEDNLVMNVDRTAITTDAYQSWNNRKPEEPGVKEWYPSTNVVIRGNFVDNIGGDGIVVKTATKAIVEYNIAKDCNKRSTSANVAIWCYNTDDSVIQYNEAYLTRNTQDGQGYDSDYMCNNSLFQYNYSHDNVGGFMLMCVPGDDFNYTTTVRYNISQNDRTRIFMISGGPKYCEVYNNTIYIGPGLNTKPVNYWAWSGGAPEDVNYRNNIFYNLGTGDWVVSDPQENFFECNIYYGNHDPSEPEDAMKITDDPMLAAPGSGGLGIDSVDGYKLKVGSPAIGTGVVIPNNGGKDYWGNPVSETERPNIGAYNGPGI